VADFQDDPLGAQFEDDDEEQRRRLAGAPLEESADGLSGASKPEAASSERSITDQDAARSTKPASITGGGVAVADENAEPLSTRSRYAGTKRYGSEGPYFGAGENPSVTGSTIAGGVPAMGATPSLDAAKNEIASRPPSITGESLAPQPAAPSITAGPLESAPQPTRPLGPAAQREQDLLANKPEYHGLKKVLDILGRSTGLGQMIEAGTGLGTLGYEANLARASRDSAREQALAKQPLDLQYEQARTEQQQGLAEQERARAEAAKAQLKSPEERRAYMEQNPNLFQGVNEFEKHDWVLSGKFPQKEPGTTDKKIDEYVNDDGKRVLTFQRSDGSVYDHVGGGTQEKRTGHTSPFEAFAYGTPEEKQAAQDFLALEKRLGAQYQKPDEIDRRYNLFKKDPDAYKAMFGDRGQAADDRQANSDRTHAATMLKFFQKQRDEIDKNFMLGDDEKAEKLRELDELQKPFMETARGGGGGGRETAGGKNDRVNVIDPNGRPGTIPRGQLDKAKKKGYRVAQ
jgi:hypothetical protein